jgi:6-phosphofructokinase 2
MGEKGALLASEEGVTCLRALPVEAKSAVGAGDSFLAAMVHALARGLEPVEAFRFGMAAGSAAVLTPGTNLAYPPDIERIFSSESG